MRIGLIGTGRMGVKRAEHTLAMDDTSLTWVCSRDGERAEAFIDERYKALGDRVSQSRRPSVRTDWRAAVNAGDVDGVIITSPNALHYEMGAAAVEQGLSIFMEYPHAVSAVDGRRLIERTRERGVALHVGLTHRYSPAHRKLAAICAEEDEDSLGKPVSYQVMVCSGNPISRWYDNDDLSGGMFVSSLYHFTDEVLDFFGEYRSYRGYYDASRDASGTITSDCAGLSIQFQSGCIAQLTYARGMPKPGLGTRRMFVFQNGYIVSDGEGTRIMTPEGERRIETEKTDALAADTQAYFRTAGGGGAADDTAEQAQRTLELAHAVQRSL